MPRRILLLITDLQIGGTPTVVRELAVRLHRPPGVVVEVVCLAPWGPVASQLMLAGVRAWALGASGPGSLLRVTREVIRFIRRGRFDTVFSFLVHANAVAAAARPFCGGVRFFQSIQTTQPGPAWHWRAQAVAAKAADRVVVPSNSVAQIARSRAGVSTAKVLVIPNAVDAESFEPSSVPLTDLRPYPVGFIGRLDPVKRVPLLLTQMVMLRQGVHLHVFGEGPERGRIEAQVRRLALEDRVTLHGAVARPQEALSQIGLLALPSIAEGFGLVLIEAMAAGVPVIAADVPGIRDVVRHEETGLLVHAHDGFAMGFAIQRVIADIELRGRLIRNGMEEVRTRFSWEATLPQYRRLLDLPTPFQDEGE